MKKITLITAASLMLLGSSAWADPPPPPNNGNQSCNALGGETYANVGAMLRDVRRVRGLNPSEWAAARGPLNTGEKIRRHCKTGSETGGDN